MSTDQEPAPPQIETIPKACDSITLKNPKANQTTPTETETETSSKNKSIAEEEEAVETLNNKVSPTTAADPHVENETTPKSSSLPPNYVAPPTPEPETDENKLLRKEPPDEISPAENETTSKQSPHAKNEFSNGPKTLNPKTILERRYLLPKMSKKSKSKSFDATSTDEKEFESPSKLKQAVLADLEDTKKGSKMLDDYKDNLNALLKAIKDLEDRQDQGRSDDDLSKLKQDLIKLRLQIPLKYRLESDGAPKSFHFSSKSKKSTTQEVLDMMPQLHKDSFFESSPEFKDFEARYNDLNPKVKLCLLCFSVFPENEIIKKRMMVQWWVVEGFACEEEANENFIQLIEKGFIEAVNENRSLSVGNCRMHPFYRSALVMLAEKAKFLNFGSKGEPTQNFAGSFQACLVGEGLISYEDLKDETVSVHDLEKVHLLININEPVLEFKRDWFSQMKNVNVLYLGRWEPLATGHREVDDTVFLEELKSMKYVKFLSLQGVSNMIDLPESILKLSNLEILDIRACHNLETIPERIGCLRFLTHLDMSDCYLLEHMPKSISSLEGLRVLKGFVVGNKPGKKSCMLDDLKRLKNLFKLCIYTGLKEFPNKKNVEALEGLTRLKKLTITWGGGAFKAEAEDAKEKEMHGLHGTEENVGGLPVGLEKLDLRYFPTSKTPDWLKVGKLKGLKELKKLYIRAGKFSDLGQYQDSDCWDWPLEKDTWRVEVLRLRYLPYIDMEWRQVQELFPNLVYLEQVGCPKLTLFPCDANGVWMNKKPK